MEESTLITELISGGAAGLIIVVVILFLRFLSTERVRSTEQHEGMLLFIKEQRIANNTAVEKAADTFAVATLRSTEQASCTYIQVADAIKGMASEIRLLRESHIEHDTTMTVALDDMRKAQAKSGTIKSKGVS
jgi:hypothetical protein